MSKALVKHLSGHAWRAAGSYLDVARRALEMDELADSASTQVIADAMESALGDLILDIATNRRRLGLPKTTAG